MATFKDIRDLVLDYLARSDLSQYVDRWVNHGQRMLERRLRIREMLSIHSENGLSANTFSLPSDFIEDQGLFYKNGSSYIQVNRIANLRSLRVEFQDPSISEPARFYTTFGSKLYLSSTPSSTDFELYYFAKFADLVNDSDTNWLTDNEPDLLTHAALLKAQPFIIEDQRIQVWQAYVDQEVRELNENALSEQDTSLNLAQRQIQSQASQGQ